MKPKKRHKVKRVVRSNRQAERREAALEAKRQRMIEACRERDRTRAAARAAARGAMQTGALGVLLALDPDALTALSGYDLAWPPEDVP